MPQSVKEKVKALAKTNRLITENLVDAVWVINAQSLKYEYITPSIDITIRKRAELRLERLNHELINALSEKRRLSKEIKMLHGLLPICSGCKRISG